MPINKGMQQKPIQKYMNIHMRQKKMFKPTTVVIYGSQSPA